MRTTKNLAMITLMIATLFGTVAADQAERLHIQSPAGGGSQTVTFDHQVNLDAATLRSTTGFAPYALLISAVEQSGNQPKLLLTHAPMVDEAELTTFDDVRNGNLISLPAGTYQIDAVSGPTLNVTFRHADTSQAQRITLDAPATAEVSRTDDQVGQHVVYAGGRTFNAGRQLIVTMSTVISLDARILRIGDCTEEHDGAVVLNAWANIDCAEATHEVTSVNMDNFSWTATHVHVRSHDDPAFSTAISVATDGELLPYATHVSFRL